MNNVIIGNYLSSNVPLGISVELPSFLWDEKCCLDWAQACTTVKERALTRRSSTRCADVIAVYNLKTMSLMRPPNKVAVSAWKHRFLRKAISHVPPPHDFISL